MTQYRDGNDNKNVIANPAGVKQSPTPTTETASPSARSDVDNLIFKGDYVKKRPVLAGAPPQLRLFYAYYLPEFLFDFVFEFRNFCVDCFKLSLETLSIFIIFMVECLVRWDDNKLVSGCFIQYFK